MLTIPSNPPRTLSELATFHDRMQEVSVGPHGPLRDLFNYTHNRFPPLLSAYDPSLFERPATPDTIACAFDFTRFKLLEREAFGAQLAELAARENLEIGISFDTDEKLGDRQNLTLSCRAPTYALRKRFESFTRGLYLVLQSPTPDRCAPTYEP